MSAAVAALRSVLMVLATAALLCPGDCRLIMDPLSIIKQEALMLDTCSECRQIVQLSSNMISGRDMKETVYEALHALCERSAADQASECNVQVKMYLPQILQQTQGQLKPDKICSAFGFCPAPRKNLPELPHIGTNREVPGSTFDAAVDSHGLLNPVCTLCVMVIRKLETLLPQNATEGTLKKLLEEVCDLMPQSYKDECDDFVTKYGAEIVEFLLSSAAPHTICSLLHLCFFKDEPKPEVIIPSDCESCRTLALLSRVHLGRNATKPQTSTFLQSVCAAHPKAIPKCQTFTKFYGSLLLEVLGNQMHSPHACTRSHLCGDLKKLEKWEKMYLGQ